MYNNYVRLLQFLIRPLYIYFVLDLSRGIMGKDIKMSSLFIHLINPSSRWLDHVIIEHLNVYIEIKDIQPGIEFA